METILSALTQVDAIASAIAATPWVSALRVFVIDNAIPLTVLFVVSVVLLVNIILHQLVMECIDEINEHAKRATE